MKTRRSKLDRLLLRAQQGDQKAALDLHEELQGQLRHMVRRVMHSRHGTSVITKRILDVVQLMEGDVKDENDLIQQVALQISDAVLNQLAAALPDKGTVETVGE